MIVSLYPNFSDTTNRTTRRVDTILQGITKGHWKEQVAVVRNSEGEIRRDAKNKLPCATFSGTFSTRKSDGLIEHSGLICLDFDHVDKPEVLIRQLKEDEYIYSAFISPSGSGVKALVKIPPENHLGSFLSLQERYPDIDPSGKNVDRLCFVSHDPDLYLNPDSQVWTEVVQKEITKTENRGGIFEPLNEGGRNFGLLKAATFLAKSTMLSEVQIAQLIYNQNNSASEPLEKSEVDKVISNAMRYRPGGLFTEDQLEDIIRKSVVILTEEEPEPENAVLVKSFESGVIYKQRLLTKGNFSSIIGKQKSKKTMLCAMLSAAASCDHEIESKFIGCMKGEKTMVQYFDTEQSRYDVMKLGHRIVQLGGNISNINLFSLRPYSAKQRLMIIEKALEQYHGYTGFVVIDGIADLVVSINDEAEAALVADKLLKWTADYNIHIMTVIHQNKNDNWATGHIGSAVMKKSECIISVTKDEQNARRSVVKHDMMRGASQFGEFVIEIDKEGKLFTNDIKELSSTYQVEERAI